MANDMKNVRMALARALASHNVTDAVIDNAAKQLATLPHPIRGIDICQFGICIDMFFEGKDWLKSLQTLVGAPGINWSKLEVFPFGIVNPDLVHVRMGQQHDGIPRG